MTKLTVHCVVKNEEKWIWFAIESIRDIAKEILIYDTGSTDNTVEIIKTIKDKKIKLEQKGKVDAKGLVGLRAQQLKRTKTNWFLILDGDEIWPDKTKKELLNVLETANQNIWGVVVRAWNLVGDIYHYHPESIKYKWPFAPTGYVGWANLRVINRGLPGLYLRGEYPLEAYCDQTITPIQNYGSKHLEFLTGRYLHTSYLLRSQSRHVDKSILNRAHKQKIEYGIKFPDNFKFPEVLKKERPKIVPNPWVTRSKYESIIGYIANPFKELRRQSLNLYNP